ncbi:hypothetical protein A6A08_21875 [Nocardiopsis sp. TSRI0078]|uniref:hypothetical protein n=1 Tax=unclassified Nocardiopsis TaxID=2649073 RepID=UPI00095E7A6A|nr:hypothetical protein [Nocardiopsis sp. TSRI0078]OKI21024.1 hypothetical protein A6A08_21875 [Nocardiopsis sp. TSRI0078]
MSENRPPWPPHGGSPHHGHDQYGAYDQYGAPGSHKDSTGGYSGYGGHGAPAGWPPPPGGAPVPPPGPGYGTGPYHLPHPGFPHQAEPQNLASPILALCLSVLMVVTCCGALGIVGTVFSALALSERTNPEKFRRHTRNAWIANGVVLGLVLVLVGSLVVSEVTAGT